MTEAPVTKVLTRSGGSLVINVTNEARALGLDRGDVVVATIRPLYPKDRDKTED